MAELLQGLLSPTGSVITIFSLFFTMVSGYLAALYLFLGRAPFALRYVAFALLSIGLAFLGGSVAGYPVDPERPVRRLGEAALARRRLRELRNPLPVALSEMLPVSQQEIGVGMGWATAALVYVALAYFTFLYRWPPPGRAARVSEKQMAEPAQRAATYEDLLAVPENLVAEILFGHLVTHPRPAPRHSVAAERLGSCTGTAVSVRASGPGGGY